MYLEKKSINNLKGILMESNKNKFLVIDSRPYGLFSIFLHTIDNIKWAEDNNYVPFVRWGPGRIDVNKNRPGAEEATINGDPKYVGLEPNLLQLENQSEVQKSLYCSDKVENVWEYLFNQITDVSLEQVITSHHKISDIFQVGFHDLKINSLKDKFIIFNLHSYTPLNIWLYFAQSNKDIFYNHRKQVNYFIEKYVKVKDNIQQEVIDFKNKYFTDQMIGVHIRGTDKKTESAIGQRPYIYIDDYINCIKDELKEKPKATLFVASDNNEAIEKIFKTFKNNKIVVSNCTRMKKYSSKTPIHLSSFGGPEAAKEALVDCMLLSSCSHIICTDSNLSAAALYFNPEASCTLVNTKTKL